MFTNVFSITTNVHVHKDIHKHEILRSRIIFYFVSIPFTQQYAIAASDKKSFISKLIEFIPN